MKRILVLGLGLLIVLIGWGYRNATRDPLVRSTTVHTADWPKGEKPLKILLISDIHVAGPDMPPERTARLVRQLDALHPDLVLVAGDLISDKALATHIYTVPQAIAPLKGFTAPLGVVVAMGNHDHWFDEAGFIREIPKAGLTLLRNQAVKRGPLVVGGVDDDFSHRADVPATFAAMKGLEGPRIIVTHSPDIVPTLPAPVTAVFAGHTHCGQITWPFSHKPLSSVSRYGLRFNCGDMTDTVEGGWKQRVLVTAGLGTSVLWLRYGAPPDAWLVTIGP